MAQRVEIPYKPRPLQRQIHEQLWSKRWGVLVCHRRFGKSVLSVNHLIKSALTINKTAPRLAYIAPLYKQAKQIAWDYLQHFARAVPGTHFNQAELRADFPNGGRVSLYGADNADALRGIYLDGVVLDEYAQISPKLFPEVLRPALSDRQGYGVFMGTPKGKGHFFELLQRANNDPEYFVGIYKASETEVLPQDELDKARRMMSDEEYAQEYECSFESAVVGAYYAHELARARSEGRIGDFPYDARQQVFTLWDLGVGDASAIWFAQAIGQRVNLIDYYENSGEAIAHYAKILKDKPYVYARHYWPHDGGNRDFSGNGTTRRDTAEGLGIRPIDIVPRGDIDDGIEAGRTIFSRCYFHERAVTRGLLCLHEYRKEWDEDRGEFKLKPFHNWASNGADAFRTMAKSDFEFTAYDRPPLTINTYFEPRHIQRGPIQSTEPIIMNTRFDPRRVH